MALDEPLDTDEVHAETAFKVIIDKKLLSELGGVSIDFRKNRWMGGGFYIEPDNRSEGSCSC